MPGPRAAQNLQIPHPLDWQGGQMLRGISGGGGGGGCLAAAGIDWCIKLKKERLERASMNWSNLWISKAYFYANQMNCM